MKRTRNGFSLIEMIVVVGIIALLASILFPTIQKAQQASAARKCMGAARHIAAAVRTYAASNSGWAPFSRDYYVQILGHESAPIPSAIKDFTCPLDTKPLSTTYGVKSSYQLVTVAENINGLENPSEVPLVREVGSPTVALRGRHFDLKEGIIRGIDRASAFFNHIVFADLHAQIGSKGKFLPGLDCRWWHSWSSNWAKVKSDTYTKTPNFLSVWTKPLTEDKFAFLPEIGNWRPSVVGYPNAILMRMDGFITFPKSGEWFIISYTNDEIFVWVDIDGNGQQDSGESAAMTFGSSYRIVLDLKNSLAVVGGKKYRCAIAYREGGGTQRMNVFWSQDTTSGIARKQKSLIPASAFSYLP